MHAPNAYLSAMMHLIFYLVLCIKGEPGYISVFAALVKNTFHWSSVLA